TNCVALKVRKYLGPQLTEVFKADAQAVEPGRRQTKRKKEGQRGVRDGRRQEIWNALIDGRPEQTAEKGRRCERQIRQVQQAEYCCHEYDTSSSGRQEHLGAMIYKALQNILLGESPDRQQEKSRPRCD